MVSAPLHAQRAAEPADFLALTRCQGGHAVTVTRPDVARSAQAEEVEAHEAVARGADSAATRREFAWRIAAQSGAMENRLDVLEWFSRDCP